MSRGSILRVALFCAALAQLHACANESDVKFGGPNALSPDKAPPPPPNAADAGTSGDGGGSCAPIDAGNCAVKWSTDIVPLMRQDGGWNCSQGGSCHGGAASPAINANDPKAAYDSLQRYTGIKGQPYINPCTTDPNLSSILCNCGGAAATCGSLMPKPGSGTIQTAEMDKLKAWVACGSPNN
jgi:hypothetical protein